jgi:hypothetical protein
MFLKIFLTILALGIVFALFGAIFSSFNHSDNDIDL